MLHYLNTAPYRLMVECRHDLLFLTSVLKQSKLHAPAALSLGKESSVPNPYFVGWEPEPLLTMPLPGIESWFSSPQPAVIPTELSQFVLKCERSWLNFRYYTSIILERLRTITKIVSCTGGSLTGNGFEHLPNTAVGTRWMHICLCPKITQLCASYICT